MSVISSLAVMGSPSVVRRPGKNKIAEQTGPIALANGKTHTTQDKSTIDARRKLATTLASYGSKIMSLIVEGDVLVS